MSSYRPIKDAPRDGTWILIRGRNSVGRPMIPVCAAWMHTKWCDSFSLRDCSYLANDPGADWAPLPD